MPAKNELAYIYGTKLRHCHLMYRILQPHNIDFSQYLVVFTDLFSGEGNAIGRDRLSYCFHSLVQAA